MSEQELILIPPGEFAMGDVSDGGPLVHRVVLSAYLIEPNLVSFDLWQQVLAEHKGFEGTITAGKGKGPDHPVQTVNWIDCVRWCNVRSRLDKLDACYTNTDTRDTVECDFDANGWRLATEAEWEKAARGGKEGLRFPNGNDISQKEANYLGQTSWPYDKGPNGYNAKFGKDPKPYTSPVGSFPANGYGLCDMVGNVECWCWDWLDTGYYKDSPVDNPTGPLYGSAKVFRGGSWNNYAPYCRVAYRAGGSSPLNSISFRCVRKAERQT